MKYSLLSLALVCAVIVTESGALAQAQVESGDRSRAISVNGTGQVRVRPQSVEITLRCSGAGELTNDAISKHRDAKKRTLEAYEKLGLKNLKLTEHSLSVQSGNSQEAYQAMMRGMPAPEGKPQINISSALRLELTDIKDLSQDELLRTVGQLMDVAQDSGSSLGPSPADVQMAYRYGQQMQANLVRYVVRDLNSVREKAYELAVADARSRAERLAKLHGLKLGPAVSVNEVSVSGDESNNPQQRQPWQQTTSDDPDGVDPQITSETHSDIVFKVRLTVRFAVEGPDSSTASR